MYIFILSVFVLNNEVSHEIHIWDWSTNKQLMSLKGHTNFITVLKALGVSRLASGSRDKTVRIWDLKQKVCLNTLRGHSQLVCSLELVAPHRLASGSTDCTIRIWNLRTGECARILSGHEQAVTSLALVSGPEISFFLETLAALSPKTKSAIVIGLIVLIVLLVYFKIASTE